jgi:hypothetical protein
VDARLAQEVITGVSSISGVQTAEIADERGEVLARAHKPVPRRGAFASWFATTFIEHAPAGTRALLVIEQGKPRLVGTVSVSLSRTYVADSILLPAVTTVMASFVQAFLLALALLWLSSRLVTGPLRRAANAIARMEPDHPEGMSIPVPPLHRSNELGHLLSHANGLLGRLAESQEQLRHLATRDPLTQLPNRAVIRDQLTNALRRARRNGQRVPVLFVDPDRFKNINDSFGHDVGDELLMAVAETLTATVRANDTVGRLGGGRIPDRARGCPRHRGDHPGRKANLRCPAETVLHRLSRGAGDREHRDFDLPRRRRGCRRSDALCRPGDVRGEGQ